MDLENAINQLRQLDTSCLCDADKSIRAMDSGIRPLRSDLKLIGRALTVSCQNDFLTVIKALRDAEPGDVLVVDGQGGERALAGELFTREAARKGMAGLIIDGAVRDTASVRTLNIPVYSRTIYPISGTSSTIFETQIPIICGGVAVNPGDVVFGDRDGVIVVSAEELDDLIPIALDIKRKEQRAINAMTKGRSLLDLMNFDEHYQNVSANRESALRFLD